MRCHEERTENNTTRCIRPIGISVVPKLRSSDPCSKRAPQESAGLSSLQRELSVTRARLAEANADRALLLETVSILEHDLQKVQELAYHDELTGLPNRRLLKDRYKLAVARSDRQRENVGLLIVDIDKFKSVNDTYGHGAADRLLQLVAKRLLRCTRASDTACRYGGDEFVVLLSDCNEGMDAAAAKIRGRLSAPFLIESASLAISVSIGAALYPADGTALSSLIRAADTNIYCRKAGGSKVSRGAMDCQPTRKTWGQAIALPSDPDKKPALCTPVHRQHLVKLITSSS
jgi:diguanylate cyclase (GGDEF)-like protein